MEATWKRWRGLKALVQDAVEHGSRGIERVQKETAAKPFAILEMIPPLAIPAKGVHEIHDTAVSAVHGVIRLVNRVVGDTLEVVLDAAEEHTAHAAHAGTASGHAGEKQEAPPPEVS
jgi:hypothetical protein